MPFLIKGPGISPNSVLTHVASMADVTPTLLELVGGAAASASDRAAMDGTSWAALFSPSSPPPQGRARLALSAAGRGQQQARAAAGFARTATLVEYQPGGGNRCSKVNVVSPPDSPPSVDYNISCHYHDSPNNSFAALRIIAPQTGDLLYAEFVDGDNPAGYYFAPSAINFRELYNVTEDYYMLHNVYESATLELKELLHTRLQLAVKCRGSAECNTHLTLP